MSAFLRFFNFAATLSVSFRRFISRDSEVRFKNCPALQYDAHCYQSTSHARSNEDGPCFVDVIVLSKICPFRLLPYGLNIHHRGL